jgi:ribonuclease BN (tRNA processing enzyme)
MDRRTFVGLTLALAGGAPVLAGGMPAASPARPRPGRTRLILLGTAGGPRPRKTRAASSQVVIVDDSAYVVDCGDGVARQLVLAEVPLATIRHIFLTHHHSDHNADYGNLLLLAWTAGLREPVRTWGPPPLREMTRHFLELNAFDIETRTAGAGLVPLARLIKAHELTEDGVVMEDERVKVTAALVPHLPVGPSFAYRFDTPDRSIVISGDTTRSDRLIRLARGADILVHEALFPEGMDRLVAGAKNAANLKRSIQALHTTVEDAGRVAQAAGVKTLVLSHLVPAEDPAITDRMWIDAASRHFRGRVVMGRDLLEI